MAFLFIKTLYLEGFLERAGPGEPATLPTMVSGLGGKGPAGAMQGQYNNNMMTTGGSGGGTGLAVGGKGQQLSQQNPVMQTQSKGARTTETKIDSAALARRLSMQSQSQA